MMETTGRELLWSPLASPAVLVGLALLAGAAVVVLYARQRRAVRRRAGWWLVGLRLAVVGLIVILLGRPLLRWVRVEQHRPIVAVLVDESASMALADPQASPAERMRWAALLGVPGLPAPADLPESDQALAEAYAALAPADRSAVDAALEPTRLEIAHAALTRPGPDGAGVLERLGRSADVRLYRFAEQATLAEPASLAGPTLAPAARPMRTDLAEALQTVLADAGSEPLAGVLVLTDGRHNANASPLEPARRLARQDAPVLALLVGSRRPPTDAAVTAVEAPESVFVDDRLEVRAAVKLDGLAGRTVRVRLMDGEREVDGVDLTPAEDAFRTEVRLHDTPEAAGLHAYRVAIEPIEGEALAGNNAHPLRLAVTDERTHVLLIDSRPRWEFRYLKNLLATRDTTVRLQHVLLEPIGVKDRPGAAVVPASATRDDPEATALPVSEAEWMKFDVVLLGDVGPGQLGADQMERLERFVGDRGGTLVVLAGPAAMPSAWAGTALVDLLPVSFSAAGSREGAFRLALTDEGRSADPMRLTDATDASAGWAELPELYWRAAVLQAKPTASVWAWAAEGATTAPATVDRATAARHALIAAGDYGLGKVLWVGFDATWRLRYRVGDALHHRFWGQLLRWATAARLPAGTPLVKLGLDRAHYGPTDRPTVRARLLDAALTPVRSDQVAVEVFRQGRLVLRQPLRYLEHSPGLYEGQLPPLPGGEYTLVLDAPAAEALLAGDGPGRVQTAFTVDPASPAEQVDLAADDALLGPLAAMHPRGQVADVSAIHSLADQLAARPYATRTAVEEPLYNHPALLALLVGLASAEWIGRKRLGLP